MQLLKQITVFHLEQQKQTFQQERVLIHFSQAFFYVGIAIHPIYRLGKQVGTSFV